MCCFRASNLDELSYLVDLVVDLMYFAVATSFESNARSRHLVEANGLENERTEVLRVLHIVTSHLFFFISFSKHGVA